MSKEKQIEEMAHDLCGRCQDGICVVDGKPCNLDLDCTCQINATTLYNAGYRKQSEGEWVSVEEKLPEPYTWVTVYNPNGKYTKIDTDEIVGGNWVRNCGKVTHWMPLPEPPKGKQSKDSENYEKKRLLPGDCFHGEIWYMCPYCFAGIEAHSIPKDRICHKCGKEYL